MTLEGAINFNENDIYTIYTMNSASAGQYCVVLPKNNNGVYNMLVDLHMKALFDQVNTGAKTKDDLVGEINTEYNKIKTKYVDAILVIPMLNENDYVNIINTGDKQKMFDEVKKIGAITSELYKKLTTSGIEKSKIDQKIIILEKNDYDKKFVEWLIGQMPNFVSGVSINEFNVSNDNPFMANTANDIFGTPVADNSNVAPVVNESVNQVNASVDLFGNSGVEQSSVQEPVVQASVQESVVNAQPVIPNIFGEQPQEVVQPTPQVDVSVQQPVVETPVVEPQPVQGVELDKTVTFSPVADNATNNNVVQQSSPEVSPVAPNDVNNTGEQVPRKSNGFVNLAILLVVLVGVTLVSIELGKFLYNTYGV